MSDSSLGESCSALTKGRQMLRVKVLAAPIDMTAAGTSAPMAMAAKVEADEPVREHLQEELRHHVLRVRHLDASRPAHQAEQGDQAKHQRIGRQRHCVEADGLPEDRGTPVSECGYMNSAMAEPSASVMNGTNLVGVRRHARRTS